MDSVAEVRHTLGQHTAVTRAGNGDILAMYGDFTDQMEGQTGYLVRSRDGGESWGEPELALRPRWWRGGTHTSLGMQTLSDGRILLPWTHGESLKHNPTGRTRFVCLRSDDHGRSWQGWDEHALPFHRVSPYGTIVELADGTLLCPVHGQLDRERGYLGTCFVLRSSDRGVTWGDHSFICHEHPNGASETDVTLLPDGRLLALIRTVGFPDERPPASGELPAPKVHWVDYAHSEDGGRTWSEPRRTDVVGQNMNAWVTAQRDVDRRLPRDRRHQPVAGGADPAREPPVQRSVRLRDSLLHGGGSRRRLTMALPVHAARSERAALQRPPPVGRAVGVQPARRPRHGGVLLLRRVDLLADSATRTA